MSEKEIIGMLKAPSLNLTALSTSLDALSHEQRVALLPKFTRRIQRRLYDAAQGHLVTMEDMVPASYGPLEEVIHEGINTLVGFRFFQKRFCKATTSESILLGYNHQDFSGVTGPGYFEAYVEQSEFCIDYRKLPTERPTSWPKLIPNEKKLGRFVYAGTVDKMRKVSTHVTIGRAYKGAKALPAWFILIRKP